MEVNQDYTLIRLMFSSEAFGDSGSLKNDIMRLCKQMQVHCIVFDDLSGVSQGGFPGSDYLFGGRKQEVGILMEVYPHESKSKEFREKVLALAEKGNDTILSYSLPTKIAVFGRNEST